MRRYPLRDDLLAEAIELTGHSDFGPGDFREGLDVLLESLEHDADLAPATDGEVIGALRRRLVNRLTVEAWYREHPEIADLHVSGPDRHLRAAAHGHDRARQHDVARSAVPLSPRLGAIAAVSASDTRRARTVIRGVCSSSARYDQLPPEFNAMHIYEPDATMEDTELLGMAFHGQQYTLPVYGYHAWWRGADLTSTFAYHRRVVKLLQSRRPPDLWLFKAPHHKFHLEAIVPAYPDVRFVMTHRDPAKVGAVLRESRVGDLPGAKRRARPAEAGQRGLGSPARRHAERDRGTRRIGEERFLDVHHRELAADPVDTLRRIYDSWGSN